MAEDKQIEALAATINSHLRSDSMSRALASLLYEEGWRKDEKLLINEGKSNNSEFISNKQIDGMARLMCKFYADDPNCCRCPDCWVRDEAKDLYEAGYQRQEWISVEERLPEEKVMVLGFSHTVFKDGGHYDLILVMELKNGLFVPFNCSPIKNGSVTHWMPLPEPPKMKGE